ncbi:MAG: peptidoglycan DD-metalloendopeptidase family protein [Anaerolineales bacterium]|nr:peptidoglycan DD-metalloendopeptidase family protein [Anaerolineales bacterium]
MPDNFQLPLLSRARVWLAPSVLAARDFLGDIVEDMPLMTRIASHVGLILLMVVTIAASGIQLNLNNDKGGPDQIVAEDTEEITLPDPAPDDGATFFRAPVPITNAPKRTRRDVVKYTVQPGDNVSSIADDFEVSADSLLWANGKLEDNPDMLSVGQTLNIPPVSGVLHTVQNGESVRSIADKYKSKKLDTNALVQNIVNFEFNQERHDFKGSDYVLTNGQFLMVPGGTKPYQPRVVYAYSGPIPATAARGTGAFGWPVSGRITQKFWSRHLGIDIGAPKGAAVLAADSGYVIQSGWSNVGYGFMILINHGNGYLTRYGHLSTLNVEVGDSVKKGQLIGRVGSTGNSTGPHLHFEIIRGAVHRNPFGLLPGR